MVAASSSSQLVELRPYQSACLEAAKERNILAVLPTNSGKTLIAASLAEWYFSRTPPQDRKKVIFLANTGPLVEQQAAVLAAHLGAVPWDSAEQSGEVPLRLRAAHGQLGPAERGEDGAPRDAFGEAERTERAMGPEFWRSAEVFVMTPGFLRLWLMHGYLQMQHVGLFLLDEAHHTQGNDPYSVLMRRFYFRAAPAARPRVLALTASPFKGRARDAQVLHRDLRELEDLLDCCAWSSSDCCPPEADPKLELFAAQDLSAVAESFLQACAGVLETAGGAGGEQAADAVMAGKAMRRLRAIVAGEPPFCQPMGTWAGVEALHLLREVGAPAGGEAASRCEDWLLFGDEDERDSNDGASRKKAEAVEKAWRGRCGRLFAVLEAWERAHRSQHGPRALEEEVSEDLKTLSALLRERNRVEMRALVFVQTRLRASLVQRFLERDPELRGHTASVVSAGGGGAALRPGMSVKDQRAALDGFRRSSDFVSDSVRVLISTSVLEEGIDVPNCSAVIRFDPPQTPLENIQSRGRARRQGSEYIHIVAEGPVGAKHRELLADFDTHESALRSLLASQDVATSRPRSSLGTAEEAPGEVLTVPATGATVPMEMAVEFLAMVYVHYDRDLDDSIHFAETAFRTKERKGQPSNYQFVQVSSNRWCCELRLPRVGGCSVAMKSEAVVCSEELPKEEAKQSAALAGIRKLHELGVLNDRLFVEGRAEYVALLRQAKTGHAIGVGRRHRSDDQIALRTKEELVRKLPDCLRAPAALGAPRGLVLHRLRVFTEAEDLGLLLPAAVPGGPLPFVLAPPRDAPLQCALIPEGSPLHLTDAELGEVAHWTASAMELACVQKVLASSAAPLPGELNVPRIKHDWGGYQAKAVDAGAVEDGCERAWFAVVPLAPTGDIDWELLRWGLSSMERASFQPLLPGDAEQSARASLLQGRAALPGLRGRSLALRDAVLLHPDPRRPRRLQVFGYAAASEAPAAAPAGGGAGAGGLLLEAAIIHRGVENVVSAATCTNGGSQTAAATKTEVLRLMPQQCELLPLTVSQLVLLKYLPGILWRVEHLAVMRELELDWASSMAGGASLRRLAEATTHTVASAPLAELPAQGLPVASWQCDYERLEFLGDAVLKCLAGAWAYAVLPGAPEGRLSRESQVLQTNRFLRRCMLSMGWQKVMLARAFGPKQPLDALRKQTVSQKHEADVVEGLLGAAFCRAAPLETARIGNKGSVDAATAFFARFLLPRRAEAVRGSVGGHGPDADGVGRQVTPSMGCFSEMLLSSAPAGCKQSFEDGEAHPQETVAERVFHYRFRDRRILRQALAAKAGATLGGPCADGHASEFERLEFLGDAALQLLVSQYLVNTFPRLDEGEVSELRMALVCNRYLAKKLVRRFASEVEAGYPHCYFPQTLRGPVKAFASRLLREQPSSEADFVVGRGEGFAASALAGTAARAAEVTEGPKCVADLYEALVGAVLLDSDGDLAKVWEVIRRDFEVSPDAAGRGLERWREVLRGLARGALRRVPAATAQPDPDRASEARGGWPAKLDAQRRAIELERRKEAQVAARGGLAGPDLAAALQQSPAFEGADAGEWLQRQGGLREGLDASSVAAALAALEPSAVGDAVVASGASAGATAASSADSGAGVAGAGDAAVGAGAAGTGCSAASVVALGLPLQDPRAATAGHALPTPARAMAPPPPATVAHPEVNARNRLQELLQRHWRRMLTPEDISFDSHRGAGDAQYASVSIRMPAGEGRLSFVGAGRTQTQAQMAAAEAALASNEVLAAFSPGHGTGFEGVLQDVIGRAGEGGWLLKTLGQELEVAVARQRFGVPNKRKLKDVLAACPQRFELFGEGDSLAVRLRAGS